jgi:hypothetical protein
VGRFSNALKHAWNVFINQEEIADSRGNGGYPITYGAAYGARPDRTRFRIPNERSIVASIYTRLGIDVSVNLIRHVRVNSDGQYLEDIQSGLNNCLTVEANLDQAATAFRQDIALTMFDQGVAAIVPVDTSVDPEASGGAGGYDILTLRVGRIVTWYPEHVRVELYNQKKGIRQQITLAKSSVAIVENPLYSVMNEPNSTLQRLLYKLNLLDAVDDQSASGKLDLIIQLPYVIKSEARRQQAEQRRTDIEFQLKGSKYGIAYTDGTERITQLNRPAENNLLAQVEYLTNLLYSQLGLTDSIMNGTADEKTMLNYWNRSIEPILTAMVEAMRRSFLTKTARTQLQTIMYFHDPFRLIPVENIAAIADKFSRNEIMTANEIRAVIGYKPSDDPKANRLVNSNIRPVDGSQNAQDSNPEGDSVAVDDQVQAAVKEAVGKLSSSNGSTKNGSGR